jgi:hypothetical protein
MKKIPGKLQIALAVLLLVITAIGISGCGTAKSEGFAIYLTREDIPPAQMKAFSQVAIAEKPIVSIEDIITYNAQTHEMKIKAVAFTRLLQMEVPVRGKSFVVCIDRKPIYWGAFWTPISSLSFNGIVIWKPLVSKELKIITFELGYPSSSFYGGQDPRNSQEVLDSLNKAGKLVQQLSLKEIEQLPHSFKGYELYSWLEGEQWNFTLVTGTNRNKTKKEIVSGDNYLSEVGWIKAHVEGLDSIKVLLSKLPDNELILWLAGFGDPAEQTDIVVRLPPEQIIDTIKEFVVQCDLNLQVQVP